MNRLSAVVSPGGGTFGFQYDAASRRTGLTYPNGKVASYAFDELDRLTSMCNGVSNYTYQYDKTFNIKSLTGPGGLTTYNYDALYRLTEVVYPGGRQESFTYDEVGNRLTHTTPEGIESYSYDVADELLSAGSKQFRYNQNGSLTEISDGTDLVQYVYDADEQLKQVVKNSQEIAAYDYDPFGRRIAGRNGSDERQYLWDGDALLSEYSPGGTLLSLYHNGDSLDEVLAIQDAAIHYVHADHLGSIASITGAAGSVELERSYDAFGQILAASGTFGTNLGYIGREMDSDTGLIYLRARYYNPPIGRFTQKDPLFQQNYYQYCGSNPINYLDPLGLWTVAVTGIGQAGFMIGGQVNIGAVIDDEGNVGQIISVGVGGGFGAGAGINVSVTGADSITDLRGGGIEGSIGFGPVSVGMGGNIPDPGSKQFMSVDASVTAGTPFSCFGGYTHTWVTPLSGDELYEALGYLKRNWNRIKNLVPEDSRKKLEDLMNVTSAGGRTGGGASGSW